MSLDLIFSMLGESVTLKMKQTSKKASALADTQNISNFHFLLKNSLILLGYRCFLLKIELLVFQHTINRTI